jgi:hypothetical protein
MTASPPVVSQAPAPPQGPGVVPPFPAPPVEGRGVRIGLGLGVGAAVLVLVCGGGLAAAIGLVTVMGKALNEQAHVVVGDYYSAVRDKRFAEAYDSQCQEVKDQESQAEFTHRFDASNAVTAYRIGDVDLTSVDLNVPVEVTYAGGTTGQVEVHLGQSRDTGEFQVCGLEE